MSEYKYTFNKDRTGTTTKVADEPNVTNDGSAVAGSGVRGEETLTGSAVKNWADCPIRSLLGALRAHSNVEVCGDVNITGTNDVFVHGTAGSSLVKDLGLVFGGEDSQGVFHYLNPEDSDYVTDLADDLSETIDSGVSGDTDTATGVADGATIEHINSYTVDVVIGDNTVQENISGDWYLRVLRADGQAEFKLLDPVNDILRGLDNSGDVRSIFEAMEELSDLQTLVSEVAEKGFQGQQDDAEALEDRLKSDIGSLQTHLNRLESRLTCFVRESGIQLMDDILDDILVMELERVGSYMNRQAHALIDLSAVGAACPASTVYDVGVRIPHGAPYNAINEWMVQASLVSDKVADEHGEESYTKLNHEYLIMSDVSLITGTEMVDQYDPETGDVTGQTEEPYAELRVRTSPVSCDSVDGVGLKITAIFCGDEPARTPQSDGSNLPDYVEVPLAKNNATDSDQGETVYATPAALADCSDVSGDDTDPTHEGDEGATGPMPMGFSWDSFPDAPMAGVAVNLWDVENELGEYVAHPWIENAPASLKLLARDGETSTYSYPAEIVSVSSHQSGIDDNSGSGFLFAIITFNNMSGKTAFQAAVEASCDGQPQWYLHDAAETVTMDSDYFSIDGDGLMPYIDKGCATDMGSDDGMTGDFSALPPALYINAGLADFVAEAHIGFSVYDATPSSPSREVEVVATFIAQDENGENMEVNETIFSATLDGDSVDSSFQLAEDFGAAGSLYQVRVINDPNGSPSTYQIIQ